ncbi:hypothetical protein DL93DRAFT_2222028 [Clavulina sp. PMI_390]|nr:hypothetical protein DL93DRAFT_2222028 [Clavulina sp. PMI_390]
MSAEVEEFETSLKALVTAKRLSGSKLTALTELAMKNMKSDARIVSALFRTIRQVPSENKISTLYAFDSVARAAKNQAVKKGLSAKAAEGNAATFMVKLEAIVEDVFSDLAKATTEVPEIREKMNKVLDLWSKGSTFPSHIMIRLKSYAGEADPSAFQGAYFTRFYLVMLSILYHVRMPIAPSTNDLRTLWLEALFAHTSVDCLYATKHRIVPSAEYKASLIHSNSCRAHER